MKIRIVVSDFSHVEGGATAVAIDHAVKMSNMGCKVIYLTGDSQVGEKLLENNIQVIPVYGSGKYRILNKILTPIKYLWNYSSYLKIKQVLSTIPKDDCKIYIHTWTKKISSSLFSALYGKGFDVNVVAHDYFLECPNGGYFNYSEKKLCNLQPLSFSCLISQCDKRNFIEKYIRIVRTIIQKNIISGLDFKICYVSNYQKKVMRTNLITSRKDSILPNVVEINTNIRVAAENNKDIVFVGRFDKEKGVVDFINALKRSNLKAVFVGNGPLLSYIQDSNAALKIYKWVDRREVMKILEKSRFIVIPSLWHEADPLVNIEAALKGIPRIVSDRCAARDTVKNNKTGLVIDPVDLNSFSKALSDLCADDLLVKKISRDTYDWAHKEAKKRAKINKEFKW
mgnify:CR=1 FL=1|jgi:glycosyltransferase involved in cell wall biosynthesis